ncbi:MAG: metallopeptidase family protein [Elusimicrobia bacterium]|nr:metallopeptidase family protein [Elusimicrobiota bacterium]
MRFPRAEFQRLAEAELAAIPQDFLKLFHNLSIEVRALPGREAGRWKGSRTLLGLYLGLSRSEMASPYAGTYQPARIILYQRNIESLCRAPGDLRVQVRRTLRHEVAHHFGFGEEDIRRAWPEGASG